MQCTAILVPQSVNHADIAKANYRRVQHRYYTKLHTATQLAGILLLVLCFHHHRLGPCVSRPTKYLIKKVCQATSGVNCGLK